LARLVKSAWSSGKRNLRQKFHRARGRQVLHFLHIGKTGGTAIKSALKPHQVTSRHAIVLHGHRFTLREMPRGDKAIFCLRNPVTRFISGFYSRQRQGQPRHFERWTPEEAVAFAQFETPNQLAVSLSSTNNAERLHAESAMRNIGHVRNLYSQWFESEEYLLSRASDIFFIGFQETLADDFETLKLMLGVPATVKLPDDDIGAHRNPAHLDKKLGVQAIENLHRWYAEDFRFFNLCREIRGLVLKERISEANAGAAREHIFPT
jgi:hypothetical protein